MLSKIYILNHFKNIAKYVFLRNWDICQQYIKCCLIFMFIVTLEKGYLKDRHVNKCDLKYNNILKNVCQNNKQHLKCVV